MVNLNLPIGSLKSRLPSLHCCTCIQLNITSHTPARKAYFFPPPRPKKGLTIHQCKTRLSVGCLVANVSSRFFGFFFQALKFLKTAEFMPFVVFIAAPELNTLRAMHKAVVDAGLTTKVLTVRREKLPGWAFLPLLGKLRDCHVCVHHRKTIWRRRWTRAPGSAAPTATTLTWPSSTTTWTRLSTHCRTQSPDYSWSRSGSQSAGSTEDKSDLLTSTEVGFNTSPLWHWLSHTKLHHKTKSPWGEWPQLPRTLCNSWHTGSVLIYWHGNSFWKE